MILHGLGIEQPEQELLNRIQDMMNERDRWTPAPSVSESLERLSRHAPLYVFSNWSRSLSKTLAIHGLRRYFTGVLSSEELGLEKPAARAFEEFLRIQALDANACCYVGDDYDLDIRPSYSLGMFPIWLNSVPTPNPLGVTTVDNWLELEIELLKWLGID